MIQRDRSCSRCWLAIDGSPHHVHVSHAHHVNHAHHYNHVHASHAHHLNHAHHVHVSHVNHGHHFNHVHAPCPPCPLRPLCPRMWPLKNPVAEDNHNQAQNKLKHLTGNNSEKIDTGGLTIVFYRFKLKDEYWNWILAPQSLSGCSPWRFETGGHLHPLLQVGIIHCYIGTTIVGNNNQENMVTSGERDIYHDLAGFDWSQTNQDFSAWAGEGGSLVDRKSRKMRKEVKSTSEHLPSLLK